MKNIDTKSLVIGVLLTSTIFLGVAAVVPKDTGDNGGQDKWDDKQVWYVERRGWDGQPGEANRLTNRLQPQGFEPFTATDKSIFFRKRIK